MCLLRDYLISTKSIPPCARTALHVFLQYSWQLPLLCHLLVGNYANRESVTPPFFAHFSGRLLDKPHGDELHRGHDGLSHILQTSQAFPRYQSNSDEGENGVQIDPDNNYPGFQ